MCICLLDHADEAPLATFKIECQRWPAKSLISGSSGTQYVAIVAKLVCSYCGAHLVESNCKAEISFLIIVDQNSVAFIM